MRLDEPWAQRRLLLASRPAAELTSAARLLVAHLAGLATPQNKKGVPKHAP